MDLNPQRRIPDHLDTMLPSGRTVREAIWARCRAAEEAERARVAAIDARSKKRSWLARLFGGRR